MKKLFFISIYFIFLINISPSIAVNNFLLNNIEQTISPDLIIDSSFIQKTSSAENREKILEFYSNRDFNTAWFTDKGITPHAKKLINTVKNADDQGLMINKYPADKLDRLENMILQDQYENVQDHERAIKELDVQMTDLFFEFARHVNHGLLQPENVNFGYYITEKEENSITQLEEILSSNDQDPFLQLEPVHPLYSQLKNKLAEYRHIKKGGGWPVISGVKLLEKGDSSEAVAKVKERLSVTGDLQKNNNSNLFDEDLVAAVENFQERHGLKVDGIVGAGTLQQMNVPVDERIDQIIINMERVRWLPADMGDPHVMVNIPEFMLYVNEGMEPVMKMKVITGKTVSATVIFSDSIEYLEMSPYWNVPHSIATREILPKVKANRNYLVANNYQVLSGNKVLNPRNVSWHKYNASNFPYRIRQTPGLHNSLGTVKFIFPNRFNIYLHDTPSKHLFEQTERDFSHGCIRVEKPLEFAKYLLADNPEWDVERIEEYRSKKSPERVYLKEKVPVYILYFTAFTDDQGRMNFREDIYGHDDELSAKFFATVGR